MRARFRIVAIGRSCTALLAGALALSAACRDRDPGDTGRAENTKPEAFRSLQPLPREKGPGRPETAAQLAAAEREARAFTAQMLRGQISRREVTAMADIRGYRLYRRRYFGQAHAWFEAAIRIDPRYELSLYNAARTAALTGRIRRARSHLEALKYLDTPLARARLAGVGRDPDLAALRAGAPTSHPASRPAGH